MFEDVRWDTATRKKKSLSAVTQPTLTKCTTNFLEHLGPIHGVRGVIFFFFFWLFPNKLSSSQKLSPLLGPLQLKPEGEAEILMSGPMFVTCFRPQKNIFENIQKQF